MPQTGEWWNFAVDINQVLAYEKTADLHTSHRPKRNRVVIACHCETHGPTATLHTFLHEPAFTKPTMCDIHNHGLLHHSWTRFPLSSVCGAAVDPLGACHVRGVANCSPLPYHWQCIRKNKSDVPVSRSLTCVCNKGVGKWFSISRSPECGYCMLTATLIFNTAPRLGCRTLPWHMLGYIPL